MKKDSKGTVLIVDDEPDILLILAEILKRFDFIAITAKDGASAIEQVQQHQPDIIVLDVMLPDIDGFQLYEKLKRQRLLSHTPVVFLSAMSDTAHKIRGLDLEAVDYITKPFQSLEVVMRLERHMACRKVRQRLEKMEQALAEEIAQRQQLEKALDDLQAKLNEKM
ncbi:response regulator [Anaerolineales bacterium HSG6]|nr:response regulator [Anaerolineales bacterium HSG6]